MELGTSHARTVGQAFAISRRLIATIVPDYFEPEDLRAFDHAIAAERDGLQVEADKFLARFENAFGITDDDRILAGAKLSLAPTDQELLTIANAEQHLEAAKKLSLPSRIRPGEYGKETRKLREKRRSLVNQARGQILTVGRTINARRAKAEAVEVRRGLLETVELGQLRGEDIGYSTEGRRLHFSRRGGLESAFAHGLLDDSTFKAESLRRAAIHYRDLYEVGVGKRSASKDLGEGGGGSSFPPKVPTRAIDASLELSDARRNLTHRQRRVLDSVCGEDASVNETANQIGCKYETAKRALVKGLEEVGANLGWW